MARSHALVTATLFALVAGLAGCQGKKQITMVDALPPPNFGGPPLASPPLVLPQATPAPPRNLPNANPEPARPKAQAPPAVASSGTPRAWVPVAASNAWRWIVIHHSATTVGGAARFDREHRAKGWDELGYHFVIGNGTDTGNGDIEVGGRWPRQKQGAHAKTADDQFNKYGIGICLVGNFDQSRPTDAQLKSLVRLTAYLMKTYRIPPDRIIGHGDTKATDCPGRNVSIAAVRRMSAQMLAASGEPAEVTRTASVGEELLVDQRLR